MRGGGLSFFGDIALVLIDEVHLLSDPRGAALEAVVSRIKMLSRVPGMSSDPISTVRFIAVSATIPNIGDIGNIKQEIGLLQQLPNYFFQYILGNIISCIHLMENAYFMNNCNSVP